MSNNFSSRTWLNEVGNPSTGSLVIYDGPNPWQKEGEPLTRYEYIEVADCKTVARLHKMETETLKEWKFKVDNLVRELIEYQKWLSDK